jgi:hypothetical protein
MIVGYGVVVSSWLTVPWTSSMKGASWRQAFVRVLLEDLLNALLKGAHDDLVVHVFVVLRQQVF